MPITFSVVNGCAASFSDCPGAPLQVVATVSSRQPWKAPCLTATAGGRATWQPSAIHPSTVPAGSVAAKLAQEARVWLNSVWPHLQMVDPQGPAGARRAHVLLGFPGGTALAATIAGWPRPPVYRHPPSAHAPPPAPVARGTAPTLELGRHSPHRLAVRRQRGDTGGQARVASRLRLL